MTGRIRTGTVLATLVSGYLAACGSDPRVLDPPSFDRSERLEWACFGKAQGVAVPLEKCRVIEGQTLPEHLRLHVLVTQTARGEIGAIDIDYADASKSRRVDNDIRVPGFTFPAVGEIPAALVVPTQRPDITYTANFGSNDITLLATAIFRASTLPPWPEQAASVPLPGAPTDMVLSPDEDALFVALPELGAVGVLKIASNGALFPPTLLPLTTPAGMDVTLSQEADPYVKVCPADARLSPTDASVVPPARCMQGECAQASPRPWALEVDAISRRLLVADASLPVVHVIDVDLLKDGDAGAELTPVNVGSPTVDLTLSPPVPRALVGTCDPVNPSAACERYLYALDAIDGSVIPINYSDGSVIAVASGSQGRPDRIHLAAPGTSLALIASDTDTPVVCTPGSDIDERAGPNQLRGVFVAVPLRNGLVQFIDVWDLDAPCRGGPKCDDLASETGGSVYIGRHRARLVSVSNGDVGLLASPTVTTLSSAATFPPTGVTESDLLPDLAAVGDCPPDQQRGFPDAAFETDILVCATSDPWERTVETWAATWQGELPGASGGGGRLVAEGHNITATTNFCGVGVIGAADIADSGLSDSDPEFGYDGDRVVIMSNLPVTAPQDCQSLVQTGLSGRTLPLAFAVEMAKPDELVLSSQTIGSVSASFERVAECFGELVQFAVTARDAYLVKGDRSGVRHRVIEENGRCLVDRALDVRHQMRAFSGVVYTNGALSFKLAQPKAAVPEGEEVNVYFPLRELLRPITIDAGASNIRNTAAGDGTLPSFIRFSTSNQRLYTVDSALSGVVQFDVTPLAAESFFE